MRSFDPPTHSNYTSGNQKTRTFPCYFRIHSIKDGFGNRNPTDNRAIKTIEYEHILANLGTIV